MKGLNTLIKLHKRKVDEIRRQIGSLENQKSQLFLTTERLKQELKDEINLAEDQPEMGAFFGGFAKRIQKRQEEITQEIKKLDAQIAKLRDEVAEAFSELKKFELAKENALKREKEEEDRKETIMLDDIASDQHRRKEKESQG